MPKPAAENKRSANRQRQFQLKTRLNNEERAMYEALFASYARSVEARVYGNSPGGFLRYVMFGRQARPVRKLVARQPSTHPSAQELTLLRNDIAIAMNNLNQLTRGLHRHQLPVPDELHGLIGELRDAAAKIKTILHPPLREEDTPDDRQGQES
jgi:hypothetical protein